MKIDMQCHGCGKKDVLYCRFIKCSDLLKSQTQYSDAIIMNI